MRKLMSVNLFRLWRNKIFWICAASIVVLQTYGLWDAWKSVREFGFKTGLADQAFSTAPGSGLILAVFCGLFLGSEFSSGAIRNKLVGGHSRTMIYLSSLLTCILAGLCLAAFYAAVTLIIGIPLLGFFEVKLVIVGYYTFCMLCVLCVFAAILVLLVMQCANRTAGVVLGMLLMLGMLFVSAQIEKRLSEPENNVSYTVIDSETYRPLEVEETPNPLYLTGMKREVYQWLHDILPTGQSIQIGNLEGVHPLRWPPVSAVVFLLVTGAGIWLFRRKDLN